MLGAMDGPEADVAARSSPQELEAFAERRRSALADARLRLREDAEAIMLKTYTRWWLSWVEPRGYAKYLSDGLVTAVRRGAVPIKLLEALESRPDGSLSSRAVLNPSNRFQRLDNLSHFQSLLASRGARACSLSLYAPVPFLPLSPLLFPCFAVDDIVNIGPEDLESGDVKLILGLTYKLINHYEPSMRGHMGGALAGMLSWMRGLIAGPPYNLTLPEQYGDELCEALTDGAAFCAVVHACQPMALDYAAAMKLPHIDRLALAFGAGEKFLVAALLDASDVLSGRQEPQSLATYLAKLRTGLTSPNAAKVYEASVAAIEAARAAEAAAAEAESKRETAKTLARTPSGSDVPLLARLPSGGNVVTASPKAATSPNTAANRSPTLSPIKVSYSPRSPNDRTLSGFRNPRGTPGFSPRRSSSNLKGGNSPSVGSASPEQPLARRRLFESGMSSSTHSKLNAAGLVFIAYAAYAVYARVATAREEAARAAAAAARAEAAKGFGFGALALLLGCVLLVTVLRWLSRLIGGLFARSDDEGEEEAPDSGSGSKGWSRGQKGHPRMRRTNTAYPQPEVEERGWTSKWSRGFLGGPRLRRDNTRYPSPAQTPRRLR